MPRGKSSIGQWTWDFFKTHLGGGSMYYSKYRMILDNTDALEDIEEDWKRSVESKIRRISKLMKNQKRQEYKKEADIYFRFLSSDNVMPKICTTGIGIFARKDINAGCQLKEIQGSGSRPVMNDEKKLFSKTRKFRHIRNIYGPIAYMNHACREHANISTDDWKTCTTISFISVHSELLICYSDEVDEDEPCKICNKP